MDCDGWRLWYNMRMKKVYLIFFLTMAALGAVGETPAQGSATNGAPKLAASKVRVKCAVCNGKGHLTLRPPDYGQHGGRIESKSHWDIKLDTCPVCGRGHGWRTVWDLTQPEPSSEPPCLTCGWSGLTSCRKCLASGLAKCPRSDCKDGWIVTKAQNTSRRSTSRKPPTVTPCPECKGVGKVICPACQGLRAELCKRCFGTGRKSR